MRFFDGLGFNVGCQSVSHAACQKLGWCRGDDFGINHDQVGVLIIETIMVKLAIVLIDN